MVPTVRIERTTFRLQGAPRGSKVEFRTLVAPGLYLHARGKADGSAARHWQYRTHVGGVRRWLSLGAYPAVGLAKASAELLTHQTAHEAAKKGEAIQACIDAPRKRGAPGAAAHVYRTLRGLVTFAIKRGHIDGADPMRGIDNPKPYRPAAVNAASDAELIALLRCVDDSQLWACTKLAIEFQLLTGARPGEVRLATWPELRLDRAQWVIPAARVKSDRDFRVHLSAQTVTILQRAERLRSDKSGFVFPGANGGAMKKVAVARALSRLAERIGEQGGKRLRPHDLRRTFRTMLSRLGVPPHVAELCLNHQETQTMRRVCDGHNCSGEMADAWDSAGAHFGALHSGGALVIPIGVARLR